MHRNNLLTLLDSYEPNFDEEILAKKLMLDFLKNNTNCFERSLLSGHFTGSSWIVNYDNSKFLLTHHKKLNTWLQLGGHADGDNDIIAVSKKEAYEESGLTSLELIFPEIFDIGVHEIPEYKGVPVHYHYDVRFLLKVSDPFDQIRISNESNDLRWFEVPPTDNKDVNRMYSKWKNFNINGARKKT